MPIRSAFLAEVRGRLVTTSCFIFSPAILAIIFLYLFVFSEVVVSTPELQSRFQLSPASLSRLFTHKFDQLEPLFRRRAASVHQKIRIPFGKRRLSPNGTFQAESAYQSRRRSPFDRLKERPCASNIFRNSLSSFHRPRKRPPHH